MTPMMRQWMDAKEKHPDSIIFFRSGDFFEIFNEDAPTAAKELNIALTKRKISKTDYAMCGMPHLHAPAYAARLVKKGYKVVFVDQIEDPKFAKGIVKRAVTKVLTRGTLDFDEALEGTVNNFIVAVAGGYGSPVGLATADLTTGELYVMDFEAGKLSDAMDEIARLAPAEVLCTPPLVSDLQLMFNTEEVTITPQHKDYFDTDKGAQTAKHVLGVSSLECFGVNDSNCSVGCVGALFSYFVDQLHTELGHFSSIGKLGKGQFMELGENTIRGLELVRNNLDGSSANTLLSVLNAVCTPFGGRLLRRWILRPSRQMDVLNHRLDLVELFVKDFMAREELRETLTTMSDIERLSGRISSGRARPSGLGALRRSLLSIPMLADRLKVSSKKIHAVDDLRYRLKSVPEAVKIIETTLVDDPKNDGGFIRPGFNSELDQLRQIQTDGEQWLEQYAATEKAKTGIKNLKIGFNRAFGYYLEVSKSSISQAPDYYEARQTLVNAQRYITLELKEYETKLLGATDSIAAIEAGCFAKLIAEVRRHIPEIIESTRACAELDVITAFAAVAAKRGFVRPKFNEGESSYIHDGRHPVVETAVGFNAYVPNDTKLGGKAGRIHVITGPNMSGKSTLLRQVAIVHIMAQLGSFVPAQSADLMLVDKVFTRIGAGDAISKGQSTFLVEMIETANILRNSTANSLVLLDEVGRGTSTFDGVSIAWAIVEYLHSRRRGTPLTLFATHYHQLLELADILEDVRNYHIGVEQKSGRVKFSYKLEEGGTDKSYGVHVAELAGIPKRVIKRAEGILEEFEMHLREFEGISTDPRADRKLEKRSLMTYLSTASPLGIRREKMGEQSPTSESDLQTEAVDTEATDFSSVAKHSSISDWLKHSAAVDTTEKPTAPFKQRKIVLEIREEEAEMLREVFKLSSDLVERSIDETDDKSIRHQEKGMLSHLRDLLAELRDNQDPEK